MPRLWTQTIEAHRREVHDAVLDATAALVAEHGLLSVTMSQIAEKTGIGRATLYKYFPDVEAILTAWHERQVTAHLAELTAARDRVTGAYERLLAVLEAYALIQQDLHQTYSSELAAHLHEGEHVARADEAGQRQRVQDGERDSRRRGDPDGGTQQSRLPSEDGCPVPAHGKACCKPALGPGSVGGSPHTAAGTGRRLPGIKSQIAIGHRSR